MLLPLKPNILLFVTTIHHNKQIIPGAPLPAFTSADKNEHSLK